MKPMSRKEYIATLSKDGWTLSRKNGKHDIYTHPLAPTHIAVTHSTVVSAGVIRQTTPRIEAVRMAIAKTNNKY